jgi:small neutral amino acid transporter SnatA (MarC family)
MKSFLNSTALLLIILNPFLVIVYVIGLVQELDLRAFARVLIRGGLVATAIFASFALLGDFVLAGFLQAEFASFQIFGGVIFLILGINFMLRGNESLAALRGPVHSAAATVAMPILVGPASVSASVIIGKVLSPWLAVVSVSLAVGVSVAVMIALKVLHDRVRPRHERLVERYVEVAGRLLAFVMGTYAVEMIMKGTTVWIGRILAALGAS